MKATSKIETTAPFQRGNPQFEHEKSQEHRAGNYETHRGRKGDERRNQNDHQDRIESVRRGPFLFRESAVCTVASATRAKPQPLRKK